MTHISNIDLDFDADLPKLCIATAKQRDTGSRILRVSLYSSGVSYEIPEEATVRVRMKKPSGAYIYNYCEVADNKADVMLTTQCLAEEGTVMCDLEVDMDDKVLSTVAFTMEVYSSPYDDDAVESSDEMNAVDQKFHDIQNSVDDAKEWASVAQAVTGVNVATYELAGIVKPDPESMTVDQFGRIAAKGAVADISTVLLLYGFRSKITVFNEDDSISETDADGYIKNTVFNEDGSIFETFISPQGETIREKTTIFNEDGSIVETSVFTGSLDDTE
jgi:hypothetical protein